MKGSCLCGAVAYEIDRLVGPVRYCHCRTCQKAQGAAFAPTARVQRQHFRWLKGEDRLSAFESTPGKLRRFCSVCGSHLLAEWLDQPQVILRVATLDENPHPTAYAHIWVSHDEPWMYLGADVPAYAEFPPPEA
jgi:ADP-ribosyl-[dinitrogen reductase] hydrolase